MPALYIIKMRVFEERQRFNQWWLYAIFLVILVAIFTGIFRDTDGFSNFDNPVLVLVLLAGVIPMALILYMQLETRIDGEGIKVMFVPFGFSKRFFSWKEMEKCYVRKYNPLVEYGGWGMKGIGNKKAYNVAGNLGIQIVTRENKTFLVGTRNPDAARAVIKNYEHKIGRKTNNY